MSGLPPLGAGDLRNRIEIRRQTKSSDGKGGFEVTFPVIARVAAEVLGQDGREAVLARALQGVSTYRIRIRWRAGIRQADQLRFDGRDLNIKSVSDPNGDREQLVIFAETLSAQPAT